MLEVQGEKLRWGEETGEQERSLLDTGGRCEIGAVLETSEGKEWDHTHMTKEKSTDKIKTTEHGIKWLYVMNICMLYSTHTLHEKHNNNFITDDSQWAMTVLTLSLQD